MHNLSVFQEDECTDIIGLELRMFRQFVGNQVNLTEQALPEHPEIGLFFYITIKAAKLSNNFFLK